MTTSLLTDRYELTMLASFVEEGIADRPAVFEVFSRRLPAGRRYGVVAGTGRLLALLEDFRFDADEVDWLLEDGVVDAATADYLRSFRFTGDVDGLREGDPYFPGTPVLTVRATLGEGVLLETLVLSVLNHDTAVASAATRMVTAAGGPPEQGGRPLIEMGSRRVHEDAAVAGARAAYLAGFAATSNLAAGHRYGVPTTGTAAHAFTLAHAADTEGAGERAAFRAQVAAHGAGTTLLVDTYDIARGVRNAVAATRDVVGAATGPGAIRIDSGDLAAEARRARALLDGLGATDTRITVTSDLDEHVIAGLADAPVDGLGAGTRVATGSGHPTAGFVHKLVAVATAAPEPGRETPMRRVAKRAAGKAGTGGAKTVWRTYDRPPADGGTLLRELHALDGAVVAVADGEHVHLASEPLVRRGATVHRPSLAHVRLHTAHSLASLPTQALDLADGPPAITPEVVLPEAEPPAAPSADPTRTLQEA